MGNITDVLSVGVKIETKNMKVPNREDSSCYHGFLTNGNENEMK